MSEKITLNCRLEFGPEDYLYEGPFDKPEVNEQENGEIIVATYVSLLA